MSIFLVFIFRIFSISLKKMTLCSLFLFSDFTIFWKYPSFSSLNIAFFSMHKKAPLCSGFSLSKNKKRLQRALLNNFCIFHENSHLFSFLLHIFTFFFHFFSQIFTNILRKIYLYTSISFLISILFFHFLFSL